MHFSKISKVAHYVPEQVITNHDLARVMDTSDEWIASRTGIKERRVSYDENTSDLASKVAQELLNKANLLSEDVDFIIVATITPDSMMPSTAALVQGKIGAHSAFAFDITAACSGFVFALSTADKLISSGVYRRGLVIGAEVFSKTLDWSDRSTAVLFGDGAGGVLLEATTKQYFKAESLNSDGSRGGCLTSGQRGLSSPFSKNEEDNSFIQMDGRSVFDFAVRDVSKSIKALIDSSDLDKDEIDYFLLHQANSRILDKMAKKIGVARERFPANLMHYGNTSAASIPILLSELVEDGTLALDSNQTVLLSGFGGGLTWGSLIVTI